MNKKGKHDVRYYRAFEKIMDIFREKKAVTKRELRKLGLCNPITLTAILKELEEIGYIINYDQTKRTWGLKFHYNDTFNKEEILRMKLLPSTKKDLKEREYFLQDLKKYLLIQSETRRHNVIRNVIHDAIWLNEEFPESKGYHPERFTIMNPETQQLEEGSFQEVLEKQLIWNFRYLISKPYEELSELERIIFFFFLDWDLWNQTKFTGNLVCLFIASYVAYFKMQNLSLHGHFTT